MNLLSRLVDGTQVVRIDEERIDASVAIQFKDRMRELAAQAGNRLILDLGRVTFVDSSGLGAIVAVMKFLAPDVKLELAALTPNVSKVFHMTRMDTVFAIHLAVPGERAAPVL